MAISTCQKITFVSCIVLCMSLFLPKMFLPREKKDKVHSEVGPGHFPPLHHGHSFSEDQVNWYTESHFTKHYNPEAIARTKGVGKPNLLVQVIPVYGFGIFLYIIYLFFKLTSKDKPHHQGCKYPILQAEHTLEEMSTCQLQTKTSERMREKKIFKVVHPSARSRRGTRRREEKLKQLKEITQMMRERQLREGVTPEEEAEEAPYTADWEGYPEETFPEYDVVFRRCRYPSVILEEPGQVIPTAEELAERMEKEEEEEPADNDCSNENQAKEEIKGEDEEKEENDKNEEDEESEEDSDEEDGEDDIGEEQPCLPKSIDEDDEKLKNLSEREEKEKPSRRRQITFSDHRHVFHYPKGGAVGCKFEEEEEEELEEEEGDEENEEYATEEDFEDEEDQNNEEVHSETDEEKEEDPLMEAESLGFNDDDVECDPEEQEVDLIDFLQTYQPEVTVISSQSQSLKAKASGTLRMRNKKQKIKK